MGLLLDSVVMTDNLVTVQDSEIDRGIGRCGDMRAVDAALRHTLGLETDSQAVGDGSTHPAVTEQHQLFDTEPEPWEADDQSQQLVAAVVLSAGPAQEFDYLVPDALRETVELGRRVKVPLGAGNRLVVGYCVRLENRPPGRRRLKPLHSRPRPAEPALAGHAAADALDRRLLSLRLGRGARRRGAGRRAHRAPARA